MPEFQYLAIRPGEHKITKGIADRPSLQAFETDAIDRRLAVLKVERKREKEEEKVSRAKIPFKVKINFFQQMATCYKLQIHLAKAFDIIAASVSQTCRKASTPDCAIDCRQIYCRCSTMVAASHAELKCMRRCDHLL